MAGRVLAQHDLVEGKHKSDSIKTDDSGEFFSLGRNAKNGAMKQNWNDW